MVFSFPSLSLHVLLHVFHFLFTKLKFIIFGVELLVLTNACNHVTHTAIELWTFLLLILHHLSPVMLVSIFSIRVKI